MSALTCATRFASPDLMLVVAPTRMASPKPSPFDSQGQCPCTSIIILVEASLKEVGMTDIDSTEH